jgi:hypothetical protein
LNQRRLSAFDVDKALGTRQYFSFFDTNENDAEGGRSASYSQVLPIEGQLDLKNLKRANISYLKVTVGIFESEVQV